MERNKTEQYSYGPEEKDILEILSLFEKELDEKLQDSNSEIEKVKYYEKFDMNGIDFNNIFITTEKDAEGNETYHVYCGDSSNELLSVDNEGKVEIKNPELEKFLGNIDLEKLMKENEKVPQRLKGISEKANPEDIEKMLDGEEQDSQRNKEEEINKGEDEEQDEETQEVEADLKEQGEDLELSKYRKIKDTSVSERMPEVFESGEENGIAFSNKLNRFVMISKVNGQYQINENIEPANMTYKSIISIDPNGQSVERKVPHALMKTNRDDKEIAVTIGQYGEIDIETIDVLPCQERIARAVRTDGEGAEKQESLEVRNEFKQEGKEYKHDIAHQVEEIEQKQKEANQTVDYDITPDDYIPNTEMTWGELMEDTGDSLPKLIERYNREMQKEGADSEAVINTIEQDYGNIEHQHKR